jgi:uncharacterized protein YbjT (DUF2867 family)
MESSSTSKPIIAVIGATGAQGGGLVRAILADTNVPYTVRAITRKADSEKALALAAAGAEVVEADLDNIESLKAAFGGCHGAFCVTNFWEHFSPEKELQQASNLAEAAKAADVKHVIWSTLEDSRLFIPLEDESMPTLQGKYKVPHFDAKGEANRFFTEQGLNVTFLLTSFYWENLIYFGMGPKPGPDGVLAVTFPMGNKKFPGIAAEDIGKCAYGIFKNPAKYGGKTVGISGEHITIAEMAEKLSAALGTPVKYNEIEPEVYRSFGFPGADDLGNMFQFNRDCSDAFSAVRNVEESKILNPELQDFATWLSHNKEKLSLA